MKILNDNNVQFIRAPYSSYSQVFVYNNLVACIFNVEKGGLQRVVQF